MMNLTKEKLQSIIEKHERLIKDAKEKENTQELIEAIGPVTVYKKKLYTKDYKDEEEFEFNIFPSFEYEEAKICYEMLGIINLDALNRRIEFETIEDSFEILFLIEQARCLEEVLESKEIFNKGH